MIKLIHLSPENSKEHSFFCIKNTKEPGFHAKNEWFAKRYAEGLRLDLAYEDNKPIGFIEYVPAKYAWRPVDGDDYLFIHCILIYPNKYRGIGVAHKLIDESVRYAKMLGLNGVCTFTSKGSWMASKGIFTKYGFVELDKKGRFELMAYELNAGKAPPKFIDWEDKLAKYEGWHLLYADQCPWHEKGVKAMKQLAVKKGIKLHTAKLTNAKDAQKAPSGFGVFALVKDGKLLEDHYISRRRFETIIDKEMV